MNITVIGGTGLIGRKLVARLRPLGHDVSAASPSTGTDTISRQGLAKAVGGADVVVDVSNSGYLDARDMERFFRASSANLLAAERKAGVTHHVVLSAVGTGRLDNGYFRAKGAQEYIVRQSGIPFTIVRSTSFFEYIYNIVDAGGDRCEIRLPPVLMQPIAADDVARAMMCAAMRPAANAVTEIAGPDAVRLPALAERILTANEDPRRIVSDFDAPFFGAFPGDMQLTAQENPRFASTRFDDWLRASLIPLRWQEPRRSDPLDFHDELFQSAAP